MTIFEKFDASIDTNKLASDIKSLETNGNTERVEVPTGNYEVKVDKMELKESKSGKPMVSIWFKIVAGDYKNNLIFMNQVVTEPFQVHIMKELLKSLDSGLDITFETYSQFNNLLLDVHEAISGKLEYELQYGEDKNGYSTFKIVNIFEV